MVDKRLPHLHIERPDADEEPPSADGMPSGASRSPCPAEPRHGRQRPGEPRLAGPGSAVASETRTLTRVAASELRSCTVPSMPDHPNLSPPEPSGPRYSATVALSCGRGHAPGEVLHALQELRSVIDDRLRVDLGGRYDRHTAAFAGTDKLTVKFTLRAATHADAIPLGGTGRRDARRAAHRTTRPRSTSRASRSSSARSSRSLS